MKQQTFQLYYPHGCNTWRTHSAPWRKLKKNYTSMNHPFVPKPKIKIKKKSQKILSPQPNRYLNKTGTNRNRAYGEPDERRASSTADCKN